MQPVLPRPRLGEILVQQGHLSPGELASGLAAQAAGRERLGETLVRLGLVERGAVRAALVEQSRRWAFASLFGAAMAGAAPGGATAGSSRADLTVSAVVMNRGAVATESLVETRTRRGGASVTLSCTAAAAPRVSLVADGAAPASLACGSAPFVVEASLRAGRRAAGPVTVEIAY